MAYSCASFQRVVVISTLICTVTALLHTTRASADEIADLRFKNAPDVPVDPQWIRLDEKSQVWVDKANRTVIVAGEVGLRRGPLEMFACPAGTKEHEAIVAVKARPFVVHAGLLSIGAKPGHPARFQPEYAPATGDTIEVRVRWQTEQNELQTKEAQSWVRDAKTDKPMDQQWVFAGSSLHKDPATGKEYYAADAGDMICVSNFPTAMLDVPVSSSHSDEALLFEAHTDQIPPRGTKVQLLLRVRQHLPEEPAPPK